MESKIMTSVRVPKRLWNDFRIKGIEHKFSFTELVERSMYLFMTDREFKIKVYNQLDTTYTGSIK